VAAQGAVDNGGWDQDIPLRAQHILQQNSEAFSEA
jgi:hypothetical protein